MARTADIQVRARRGNTTQELHRDALQVGKGTAVCLGANEDRKDFPDFNSESLVFLISFTGVMIPYILAKAIS